MPDGSYSHVIVGAGSAGCTLAYRLAEDADARVLLIEAGGWDRDPLMPHSDRLALYVPARPARLGATAPNPSRRWAAGASNSRAAGWSAAPPRPTRWPMCAAIAAITTAGRRNTACRTGPTRMSCPISAGRKAGRAAPTPGAAATGR